MVRKGVVVLLGALVLLFLTVASWPYLSYKVENPAATVTGNSIREAVDSFYETSSIDNRFFILSQVFLLIIIIVVSVIVFGKLKSKKKLHKVDFLKNNGAKRSQTDLDVLYEILKKKKEIGMEEVEGVFKISPEIAIGWSKVLENGNLAEIDYPRFGKPVLRLAGTEQKIEVEKEEKGEVEVKDKKKVINNKTHKKTPIKKTKKKKVITHKGKASKSKTKVSKKKSIMKKKVINEKNKKK